MTRGQFILLCGLAVAALYVAEAAWPWIEADAGRRGRLRNGVGGAAAVLIGVGLILRGRER